MDAPLSIWLAVYLLCAEVGVLTPADLAALEARLRRGEVLNVEPLRLTVEARPVHDGRH